MKIAIIGMGNVGKTLGQRWAAVGHNITFGARNPTDAAAVGEAKNMNAALASVETCAADAEVVVLTVPWEAVPDVVKAAGDLAGKIVLDCTNPLLPNLAGLSVGHNTSGGEEIAKLIPKTRVVKIFNTTGYDNMANPNYGGTPATMLYAGDDASAKQAAATLASDLGFAPVDFGPLSGARLLEPFALVWITLAVKRKLGRDFSLNIVQRPA